MFRKYGSTLLILSIIFTFLFTLLGCTAATPTSPQLLTVTLSPGKSTFQSTDSLTMTFTIKNVSDKKLSLLTWNTPFDGFYSDMFTVMQNGVPVDYIGMLAYRLPPTEADFMELQPNEELSVDFNLENQYAIYSTGEYTIKYRAEILGVSAESTQTLLLAIQNQGFKKLPIESNAVNINLNEDRQGPPEKMVLPRYVGCSETDENTIFEILPNAEMMSLNGYSALSNLASTERSHAERFLTWFREYSSSNYETVINNNRLISNVIGHETISFECKQNECDPGVVAYVHSNDTYRVYLCSPFFNFFPIAGQDSQAGILIHEISHFDDVAATDDNAYCWTQQDCTNLDAEDAIENADSYRRFCENDPPLQPAEAYQTSIFCQEGERCCDFNDQGACITCELTNIQCDQRERCDSRAYEIERCMVQIGGKTLQGYREVRCRDGYLVKGPCYPNIP